MTQNAANVAASAPTVNGALAWAPLGTVIPTDATSPLPAAAKWLGYISEDGIQSSGEAPSTTDVNAYGGDKVATLKSTKRTIARTVKLIEVINPDVLSFAFGEGNVTVTADATDQHQLIAVAEDTADLPKGIFFIESLLGSDGSIKQREILPNAQPILNSEDPLVHTAVGGFEFVINADPDANGKPRYRYINNPNVKVTP